MTREKHDSRGQALTEFAIIIVVFMIFLMVIIDAGRIGWAWVTVQSAARAGSRYASTGKADCMVPANRLTCVISTTHRHLDTLPLVDDPHAPWGSDNAYRIEVWGIDFEGNGPWPNNPGAAGKPAVVRAYYWVPIVNPLLRPLGQNVRVFGKVATINEMFDSMGGASAGVGLPPPLPELPVPQPTPTPTPTPTPEPGADGPIGGEVNIVGGDDDGPSGPQDQASVWLVRVSDAAVVASTTSDDLATYFFDSVPADTYEVWACKTIDDDTYVGNRSGIVPPDPLVDIFMTDDDAGCPY